MIADVIIPFHNRSDLLIRCLGSLSCTRLNAAIVLVDDGSDPAERKLVQRAIEEWALPVEWVVLPRRAGFVQAVNAAWHACNRPISIILNSDTLPPADLISKLVTCLRQNSGLAAVAPTSDNPADLYQYRSSEQPKSGIRADGLTCVPYLTAMCLAIRRSAVAGPLFDPSFSPGYFEDLDLSCRLRMAGWRLGVVENCRVHHQGRATFQLEPDLPAIIDRNYETFAGRWSHLPEHADLVARLRGPVVHAGVQA